jgi:LEA14-like dessication related protein
MRKIYPFLFALLIINCKTPPKPAELKIIEPKFEVVSIYIIQADLVVTEFETVIKIENPNDFAVDLLSIKYELYGDNYFWADGLVDYLLHIPANNSIETHFRFSMNFINTNRKLLDDVIAMRRINYRFEGKTEVKPDIPQAAAFNVNFNCSGYSAVKKRITDKVY